MGRPEIRFKGYTDEWEQRKLGDTSEKVCVGFVGTCEKYYTDETGIPMYRTGNLNGLSLNKDDMKYVTRDFHQQNKKSQLKFGDILIARHGDSGKAVNYESSEEANCLNIVIIRPDFKKCNYRFLTDCINSPRCQKHIKSLSAGSTQAVINTSEIEKLEVLLPGSIDEQEKVAAYFENLDHLITLHQRKCDEVKSLKKYMLQKMFPQNEQKIPEIRFEGFTEAWEQRKFGEITELKSASRVHKDEWTSNGVPFYRSSDVMAAINGTENEKAFISEELYEKLSKVSGKLEEGDILVTGGGSVGNPYIVPDNKSLYTKDADLLWIKNKGKFHPYFLYEFFFSPTFRNYLESISHVGTIAHYTITQLSDTPICLPSFEEQKEVGEYFQSLDHLITLHQQKCEELKKIKKFMLQKMFV